MQKTLKQMREGGMRRADMFAEADSGQVSDAEWNDYVNDAWHELYDLITEADDARVFTVNATELDQVEGTPQFDLPEDYYRLVSASVLVNGHYRPAKPMPPSRYAELADDTSYRGVYQYTVRRNPNTGQQAIFVLPIPSSETLAITYWPRPKVLSQDGEVLDQPAAYYFEYIEEGAAIRALQKVERDATAHYLAKRQLGKRIQKAVYASDLSYPRTMDDDTGQDHFGGYRQW